MRRPSVAALCAAVFTLLAATTLQAADAPWRMLKTSRYTVVSQANDRATQAWAADFDQFIESIGGLLQINPALLPPLTVVIFARDKDFEPYKPPRPDGKVAKNIGGYFYRTDSWGVIGLPGASNAEAAEQTRQTIYHEAVHWLMSADRAAQPRWFSEGIAEMFSTFQTHAGKVEWAHPHGNHVLLLRQGGLMPMKDFIAQDSSIFNRDDHTGRYYAQSWALMHYLLVSNRPDRREQLLKYLGAFKSKSAEESFRIAFGGEYDTLQKNLRDYIDQPRMGYMITPRFPSGVNVPIADAPPVIVQSALGRLALSSADPARSTQHADAVQSLDPAAPEGHELRANIAMRADDRRRAESEAELAVAKGTRDSWMYSLAAQALEGRPGSNEPGVARRRAALYENAINRSPRVVENYRNLVSALMSVDKPTDEDARFLGVGRVAYPQSGFLQIGLAQLAYRQGKKDDALTQLDAALASELSPDERRFGVGLHDHWVLDGLGEQVRKVTVARNFADARGLLDRTEGKLLDADSREFTQQLRKQVDDYERQVKAAETAAPKSPPRRK